FRRKQLETGTALYLNMAAVSRDLGDEASAMLYFQSALNHSETGVFPDFKWRALAGLNKPAQALDVLNEVPLSRAGCAPMEIINSVGSLVFEKLSDKKTDAALNLAEKISELERFNRMAPYVQPQNRLEKAFFAKLYPKLEQIQILKKELSSAEKDRLPFVKQRLENETLLLAKYIGPDHENLPAMFKNIQNKETRDLAILLMSLNQNIEKTANELAEINIRLMDEKNDTDKNQNEAQELSKTYQTLISRYHQLVEDAYYDRPLTAAPDFITLMSAEPFDVMDLAEVMTDDDAVARIFHIGSKESPYAVFLITKDETTSFIAENVDNVKTKIDESIDWITPYIAYENPLSLDFDISYPYALSAKQLQRCINNRKPFKQKLIAIPNISFPKQVSERYDITPHDSSEDEPDGGDSFETDNLLNDLSGANTLLIANGPRTAATVPTVPGDMSRRFLAVNTNSDNRIHLEALLAGASNLSLSLLKSENADHLYLTGHLFSIYGCPGIIFVNNPEAHEALISKILASYSEMSGIDALKSGADSLTTPAVNHSADKKPARIQTNQLLYLGYQGMTKKESAKYAKKNFIQYVKSGRSEFDQKNYVTATVMFENAIAVANEISKYDQYLPDLYKYARESAYLSGSLDKSLNFARELAALMADIDPDSKGHSEALLRLGLMYSKKENYEKAIPVIERAVTILSQLPPDEDLVRAFKDLGIVLENATNYDSALSRFKHAAELTRTLNQSELMGEQYLNIGRVYDLRLNQYTAAIQNYEKALEIFTAAEDFEKISESKLNIGRCYRLLGNFAEADRFYEQSLSLIESKAPDQLVVKVKILIEQANNAWFQGRYEEAFKRQRQCYSIAKEKQFSLMQVISLNTEGLIWWTLGDYDKALEALNNALTDAKSLKIRQDEVATTLNNMGLIYRDRKDYEKALETFDQAISIDTAIGSKWGLAYDYRNKGLTFLKLNQPKKAAVLFDQAYDISTAIGNRINAAKAVLGKGDALLVLEDYQNAQKAYQTALELSESMMIRETQWRSLFGLAKIQINFTSDLEAAENLLRKSLEIIEQLRSDIKIKQLKENFIANKLSVYETLVKLLADKNMPRQSFEIAERSRARNFIDLLGGQQIGFANETDN
ncbi:MAG: tetratricopeptide repeat protein, partial [Desulfobacteraceae bacterium]|nr:tetratricopeptide repeat protein [Desulfobacteraceae bacterium]